MSLSAYNYRPSDPRDACGICGGSWQSAMRGTPECQDHIWTSATVLERQALAHYGKPCDLGRVVSHSPALCPVCRALPEWMKRQFTAGEYELLAGNWQW